MHSVHVPLSIIPETFSIHFNRGCKLLEQGQDEAAELAFEKCAEVCPEAWLGVATQDYHDGMKAVAAKRLEQVLKYAKQTKTRGLAMSTYAMLLSNNGARKAGQKLFLESYELFRRTDTAMNIALSFMFEHQMGLAKKWINKALMQEPRDPQIRWNRSLIYLLDGDYKEGWKDYEARWIKHTGSLTKPEVYRPEWKGEDIAGKRLMIYAEQGAGDTVQMLRFGPLLKQRECTLTLFVQRGLKDIATRQGCWDDVFDDLDVKIESANLPHWDLQCPFMTVPGLLGIDIGNIPSAPYVCAGEMIQPPLDDRLNVGFVWSGSIRHEADRYRSTHIEDWDQLLDLPGIRWHNFQVGPRKIDEVGREHRWIDLSEKLTSYDKTASWVEGMDLMICVDTSAAHLAGAMGKLTFLLVPWAPDWRWMHDRTDSPWYPSMKLFRQPEEWDWKSAFDEVKTELIRLTELKGCSPASDTRAQCA